MARRMKRSARQEAKAPDQFITTSTRIYLFVFKHKRLILFTLIAVVAGLAAFLSARYVQKARETRAIEAFYLAAGAKEGATVPAEDREKKMREFLERYGRTALAPTAFLYLGDVLFELGKYDEAIALYEQTLEKKGLPDSQRFLAKLGIAFSYENLHQYEKALTALEAIASELPGPGQEVVGLAIGRNYELLGRNQQALEKYREVQKAFPASPSLQEIEARILELERDLAPKAEVEPAEAPPAETPEAPTEALTPPAPPLEE